MGFPAMNSFLILLLFASIGLVFPEKPFQLGVERVGIAMLAFKYIKKDASLELIPVNITHNVIRHKFEILEDFPVKEARLGWFIMKKTQNSYLPTHMQGNGSFCAEMQANRPVMRALGITSKILPCPVKKGVYEVPDFSLNIDGLPPDLKAGTQWRLASTWYVVKAPIYRFYIDIFLDEMNPEKDVESL